MRIRREFTAPFVIIVGLACQRIEPAREIWSYDADCETRAADGGVEIVPCPDEILAVAAPGRLIRSERAHDETRCFVSPRDPNDDHEGRVRCPDSGPTVMVPDPHGVPEGSGTARYDSYTSTCVLTIASNPPQSMQLDPCPPELLPKLTGGVEPTRTDGDRCFFGTIEVRC